MSKDQVGADKVLFKTLSVHSAPSKTFSTNKPWPVSSAILKVSPAQHTPSNYLCQIKHLSFSVSNQACILLVQNQTLSFAQHTFPFSVSNQAFFLFITLTKKKSIINKHFPTTHIKRPFLSRSFTNHSA